MTNLRQERVNLQEDISRQRQLEEKKLNLDREVEDLEKAVEELRDEKRPFEVSYGLWMLANDAWITGPGWRILGQEKRYSGIRSLSRIFERVDHPATSSFCPRRN